MLNLKKRETKVVKFSTRKSKKLLYGSFLAFFDLILLSCSFFLAFYLRFLADPNIRPFYAKYDFYIEYINYSILSILLILFLSFITRIYSWDYRYRGAGHNTKLFINITFGLFFMIIAGFSFQTFNFSRLWIGYSYIFTVISLILFRIIFDKVLYYYIKKSRNFSRTLIIGTGEDANRIKKTFNEDKYNDIEIIGIVDKKEEIEKNRRSLSGYEVIGYVNDIKDIISENKIETIIISGRSFHYYEVLNIIEAIKGMDVLILMFPGFFEFSISRMESREISGIPLIHIANIGFFGFNLFVKNLFDYVLGSIIFIFFIPIYLIVGFIIKVGSKGPVFYKQKRITKDGKKFYMYKFRTMIVDADKELNQIRDKNEADGLLFKIKKDPRITRVGRIIRRLSIDEIPQIINVLKGELSLIGPRPPLPEEVKKYKKWHGKRLNVKQGITGLWQVTGRSELGFEEGIKLDLYYIQNWSIGMDIKILLKTIPAVLSRRGAY